MSASEVSPLCKRRKVSDLQALDGYHKARGTGTEHIASLPSSTDSHNREGVRSRPSAHHTPTYLFTSLEPMTRALDTTTYHAHTEYVVGNIQYDINVFLTDLLIPIDCGSPGPRWASLSQSKCSYPWASFHKFHARVIWCWIQKSYSKLRSYRIRPFSTSQQFNGFNALPSPPEQ